MYQSGLWSHLKAQLGKDLLLSSSTGSLAECNTSWASNPSPPSFPYHGLTRAAHIMHQSEQVREQKRSRKTETK